jgi:mannose/fructose/N-acetylgalactosamine-specific phosphotransferase system component IIC
MNVCGWTSVLVPAFFAGFAFASLAGSDLVGWIAAVAVGLAVAIYQARTAQAAACPIPQAATRSDEPSSTRR